MEEPFPDSAGKSADLGKIRCPYCNEPFRIDLRTKDGTRLDTGNAKLELYVLPYARDVDLFDPDPREEGRNNSDFTRIGKDFFGGLNYERIGILHMERGWDVRYSVARCTKCRMLIDVFANLTENKRLAEMWPHLLRQQDGRIIPWRPTSVLSRVFDEPILVLLFFLLLLLVSLWPQLVTIFSQTVFDAQRFLDQVLPVFAVRGIVTICAFFLVVLRCKLINLFSDYRFVNLLNIKRELIAYWSNFAVCRFTGYQRDGSFLTPNAVMLIGGLSSTIVFVLAWTYVWQAERFSISNHVSSFAGQAVFWLVMSFMHGILVWSFTVIPVYVFRGLKNVPMKIDAHGGQLSEFQIVERAGRYAVRGVKVVTASAIALSTLPVFVKPFPELSVALIWAQGALIVCFSILIIRFRIWNRPDAVKRSVGAIELAGILLIFIIARVGIGSAGAAGGFFFGAAKWLGISGVDAIRNYSELVVFSVIAAYLFYRLTRDVMCRQIENAARKNRLRWYSDHINKVISDKDFDRTKQILEAPPLWSEKAVKSKTLEWVALLFAAVGPIVSVIDLVMKYFVARD